MRYGGRDAIVLKGVRKLTKNDSISIRIGGIYLELAKAMENFQNIMELIAKIEEIISEDKKAVDEGGKD